MPRAVHGDEWPTLVRGLCSQMKTILYYIIESNHIYDIGYCLPLAKIIDQVLLVL